MAAGRSQNDSGIDFALARYDSDGNLDPTFGTGGMVRTVFPTGISRILAVAIQADQKIVAAGRATGPNAYDFALARYNVDGTLDPSFGSGGMVTTNFSSSAIRQCSPYPAGSKNYRRGLEWELCSRPLQRRWQLSTPRLVRMEPEKSAPVLAITAFHQSRSLSRSDGSIVAAGFTFSTFLGSIAPLPSPATMRTASSTAASAPAGTVTTDFSSAGDAADGVVIQADGLIVAGGLRHSGERCGFCPCPLSGGWIARFDVRGRRQTHDRFRQ